MFAECSVRLVGEFPSHNWRWLLWGGVTCHFAPVHIEQVKGMWEEELGNSYVVEDQFSVTVQT